MNIGDEVVVFCWPLADPDEFIEERMRKIAKDQVVRIMELKRGRRCGEMRPPATRQAG